MDKDKVKKNKVKKNDVELSEGTSKKRPYYKAIKNVEKVLLSDKKVSIDVDDLEDFIKDVALFFGANCYMPHDDIYALWEREYLATYERIVDDEGLALDYITKKDGKYYKVSKSVTSLEPSASGL